MADSRCQPFLNPRIQAIANVAEGIAGGVDSSSLRLKSKSLAKRGVIILLNKACSLDDSVIHRICDGDS